MHPRLRDGVSIGTFQYKGSSEQHYYVKNEKEEMFAVSYTLYRELKEADGTHPLSVSHATLRRLKKKKILSTSRYVWDGIVSRFILIPFGKGIVRFRPLCRVINGALPFLAAAVFAAAVILKQAFGHTTSGELNSLLYYLFIFLSLAAHEFAHLAAGISCSYKFSEMGLLLLGILPIGAYVAHEEKKDVPRFDRMQFSLAGIEANLLLAAVFLLLSMGSGSLDTTFVTAANINVFLAILNLLPASGLDGEAALSALLETDSITESSRQFLKNRKFRQRLFRSGTAGYVCTAIFGVNLLCSVLVRLLLVCDVVYMGILIFV